MEKLIPFMPYVFTLVVGPLIGVLAFKLQSKIRVGELAETVEVQAKASAAATPLETLRQLLQARDIELKATRESLFEFVKNSMEKNDAMTKAFLELVSETRAHAEAIRAVGLALASLRDDVLSGDGKLHARLTEIEKDVAEMKGIYRK